MRHFSPSALRKLLSLFWLGGWLLFASAAPAQGRELEPAPPCVPVVVGPYPDGVQSREVALLCYHQGAAYYLKLPHPVYGDPGIIFQRITPGAAGHMDAFQLRFYNDYPGSTRHFGQLELTVHRRVAGLPGPFEMMRTLSADTVGNVVLDVPLESQFNFDQGEEFYLGMRFVPASSADTVAYVTAGLGDYTGHSFFHHNGQLVWWGSPEGVPFGDMHFCAHVWLNDEQAFLQFPWAQLDLGRGRAGTALQARLPLLNQGTAPLVVHSVSTSTPGWSCGLTGPDSLMPPDTLFLDLDWQAPAGDSSSQSELHILSNAANGPDRHIPLRAASSTAHLLLADWNEWPVVSRQLGDSLAGGGWSTFTGLNRPGPFKGHGVTPSGSNPWDVLALRNLRLQEGALVRLRWSQYLRHLAGLGQHALCWREPQTGLWQVLEEPDLTQPPWLGPEGEWTTTPWAEWRAPASGVFELGLLYTGASSDLWFVDDLELCILEALSPPEVRIRVEGGSTRLSWEPVLGATHYLVERVDCDPSRELCWTTSLSWTHVKALRLGRVLYQVTAWQNLTGEPPPASAEEDLDDPEEAP